MGARIKNLLIVESPAKAKTIEKYLGQDFKVQASYGHIRDLPKGDNAIDVQRGFAPVYEVSPDKRDVVRDLQKLVKDAQVVWLATDEDREGEAISWHLAQSLGLDVERTPRIVFTEITKNAIQKAIANPRRIDMNLVNAQQARRILDRLVGFKLSPVLWKKVKGGLSAGRVQSVAVRLIVEREREVQSFEVSSFFRLKAEFVTPGGARFQATLSHDPSDAEAARAVLSQLMNASYTVRKLEKKPARRSPAPPFTTSTLQQEAARRHGFPVDMTMRLAQSLYEAGHITYMRTDSVNLSNEALGAITQVVKGDFGEQYHQFRQYKARTANAQEAHEAIRPTDFRRRDASRDAAEQKLYDLIWKRTVACQMADAQLERTLVEIETEPAGKPALVWKAEGEVIVFDGFLKLYLESRDDDDEDDENAILPEMAVGQRLTVNQVVATQRYTQPPARFTEASLVKRLEELGIGRPSTYAPTIRTIQQRGYVEKPDRPGSERPVQVLSLRRNAITEERRTEVTGRFKNRLLPTDLGILVTDFLVQYFPDVIDYSFTAKVEGDFDAISRGEREWPNMIGEFYWPFEQKVAETEQVAERVAGERTLGIDPRSGKPVLARLGRFGPLVQLGTGDDPDKRFASLRTDQRLETIDLQEALKLFDLPRQLGEFEGQRIEANIGRFGPYVKHGSKFVSLPKGQDPYSITLPEAIGLIEQKREQDKNRVLRSFEGSSVQVLQGRWGPYVSANGQNLKLPKDLQQRARELSLDDLKPILEAAPAKSVKNSKTAAKAASTPAKAANAVKKPAVPKTAGAKPAPKAKAAVAKPKRTTTPKTK